LFKFVSNSNLRAKNDLYDVCLRAKQTRNPFPLSENKAKNCFDLIHYDIEGPYHVKSFSGVQYFLTILDDASQRVWVYLMTNKREALKLLIDFCAMVNMQFDANVKTIMSDNGAEFTSNPMRKFYREKGISHETSYIDTPQQNGRVERKHRHILNVARALRFRAHLPLDFWGECVLTTTYLINRTPYAVLQWKTPYEILFQVQPSYDQMRMCWPLCYISNLQRPKHKFASKSHKCVFIGYPFGKNRWKLYDLETGDIFVSQDVIFHEDMFPFSIQATQKDTMMNFGRQIMFI